jgi:hypothetical protein
VTYATRDDLEAWTQTDVPDNVDQLLRRASSIITRAIQGAIYVTNDLTGLPTDAAVIAALRDATCAQAAIWTATGIDPAAGAAGAVGTSGAVVRSRLLSGEVQYDTAAQTGAATVAARQATATDLCVESAEILYNAGLLGGFTTVYG